MQTKKEKQLIEKGYRYITSSNIPTEAKQKAKKMRKKGYFAQVVSSASDAIGYTSYSVFAKKKK